MAVTAFVVAWFVPVVAGGATLAKGVLPGWEALRTALDPLGGLAPDSNIIVVAVTVTSGFSNLVFLLASVLVASQPARYARRVRGLLVVVTLLNAQWLWLVGGPSDLRVGYYLWLLSFAALATSAHLSARDASNVQPAVAT
jgi:hypothetical protein